MEDNNKSAKPGKAPGSLKKPIEENRFQKRYVNAIEHPGDKTFFTECFEKQGENYVIRNNLSVEDVKKIKVILKWVNKNRKGAIKVVPLLFAGAVVAALILFFAIFANPLLGRAMELGLESAFEGKSDVRGFHLSLIKFSINIKSVTVANRDAPMTNLFELGKIAIRLRPAAVLRGKVYIEEIRADNIQFGTERKTSGALPARPPKEKPVKEKTESEGPPMIDLANFDAMGLLNQEYDKLSTPKLYDEAINTYNETLTKWQGQVDATKAKAEEIKTLSQPLMNLNTSSIRDINTIRTTVQDINKMVTTVQSAADDAGKMVSGLEADINTARQLEQNARNALTNDINYLKSFIDLGGGAAFAALEPYIRDILSDSANQYLDYGLMALEALEKVKGMSESKPKEEKPKKEKKVKQPAFKGCDVPFPVRSYPQFYLGTLASSITQGSWKGAFDLSNVSSDPELTWIQTNKPILLTLEITEVGGGLQRRVDFNGKADFRANPPEKFNAVATASSFPVSLGDQLSKAGINGFTGNSDFSVSMIGHNDDSVSAKGDIKITQARLIDPKGTIAEAAATAVSEAERIDIGIQYTHRVNENDTFKITTNIADLIAQVLKRTAEAYAKKAMDEIEKALRDRISQYIDGRFASKEDIDALLRVARGDKAAMDQVKNSLDNKKNEFEQRLKNMGDAAMNEAASQAQQAGKDLLQGNAPSMPSAPSLPSNPFRR